MEWSKLPASLPDNPRVQAAEDNGGAGWLLIQSFCYCTSAESGGFIPQTQVPRFGGPRLRQRVAALAREKLWIAADGGYLLDPEIWSEERNLSDSAEKKKQADRERIAAKRAAAKTARSRSASDMSRDMSRDSRKESSATSSRDSRTVEKRREEHPPLPPRSIQSPILFAMPDVQAEEGDREQEQAPDQLVAAIRRERPDWSTASIERALADPSAAERPWPLVCIAALIVARDPESKHAGRLAHDGPWWAQAAAQLGATEARPRPPWCGKCDERTRQREKDDGRPARCPDCHPSLRKEPA